MKMILLGLAVLVTIGCSKKDKAAAVDECTAAIARGVDSTISQRRKGMGSAPIDPSVESIPAKLKTVLTRLCKEDKWSPAVLTCFKESPDIKVCKEQLTPEQRGRYTTEMIKVMTAGRPMPGQIKGHGAGGSPAPGSAAPAPTEGSAAPAPTEGSAAPAAPGSDAT